MLAVLVLIGVVAWPTMKELQINKLSKNSQTRMKVEEVSLSLPKDGKPMELQVSKPEYSGIDDEGRPYVITADHVIQQGINPVTSMSLDKPIAKLVLNHDTQENVAIESVTGLYDPQVKTLQLNGPVKVTHSNGYVMDMQDLFVDLIKGTSTTTHPVSGHGPGGQLSGQQMELLDKGNHIILKGQSKIILTMEKSP